MATEKKNVDAAAAAAGTSMSKKIVVFGGNGYVGQSVVMEALKRGVDVLSVNRSGPPENFQKPVNSTAEVVWHRGDISEPATYTDVIKKADGAISCVGAFGSNEFMEMVNGDANIAGMNGVKAAGIPRFVYVSTVENNLPDFVLKGYFHGKRRAEEALFNIFPTTGIVLRPGMISGTRDVPLPKTVIGISNPLGKLSLPLWVIGKPLDVICSTSLVKYAREHIPGMLALLAPPVTREALGKAAVSAALGEIVPSNPAVPILTIDDIKKYESS